MYISLVKFFTICFVFLLAYADAFSQNTYWIYFTDKPQLNSQEIKKYFSEDGLSRRQKHQIPFTTTDVPVNKSYVNSLQNSLNASLVGTSKWLNCAVFQSDRPLNIAQIEAFPFVKKVVESIEKSSKGNNKINKLEATSSLQFNNLAKEFYGFSYEQINLMNLIPLHTDGYMGKGLKIGVFDAGFLAVDTMPCFERLRFENRILGTFDLVDNDTQLYDKHTHGTYVLSCISAYLPDVLIGTAPEASIYLFRTEDGASEKIIEEFNWVRAAEMADSLGIDIINSSLGYTIYDDPAESHTYADMDGNTTPITIGADIAASKGILVVNSAGNSGDSPWKYIGAPADGDSVLSVGSVNVDGENTWFSSYGPSADGRVKPNVCAVGERTAVLSFVGARTGAVYLNGTSFSSPLMAGAAASLWGKHPLANNMDIIKHIEESAHQYLNPDDRCGYGIPNFVDASQKLLYRYPEVNLNEINLFPNPATSQVRLVFANNINEQASIEVFDLSGKLVFTDKLSVTEGFNSFYFNVESLRGGVYQLNLSLNQKSFRQKFVVSP